MNVVGRVGNLISQGVYSVATPFHPFGGAVDIIAVEQEDGTYRSTPWYVRFGKFQGVIKGTEKIVTITVNGVEANFHMYLDHSGQAYFLREVESGGNNEETGDHGSKESNPFQLNQNGTDGNKDEFDESEHKGEVEKDEHSSGFRQDPSSPDKASMSPGFNAYSYGNLVEVDDLVKSSNDLNSEMVLVSVDGHVLMAPISSSEGETDDVQSSNPQFHLGPGGRTSDDFDGLFVDLDASTFRDEDNSGQHQEGLSKDGKEEEAQETSRGDFGSSSEDIHVHTSRDDLFKSCLDLTSHVQDADSPDRKSSSVELNPDNLKRSRDFSSFPEMIVEERAVTDVLNSRSGELQLPQTLTKDSESSVCDDINEEHSQVESDKVLCNSDLPDSERSPPMDGVVDSPKEVLVTENPVVVDSVDEVSSDMEQMGGVSGRSAVEEECCQKTDDPGSQKRTPGLGFEISLCGNLLRLGMGLNAAEEAFEAHRISEEEFKASGSSIIKNGNLIVRYGEKYFPWDKAACLVLGRAAFGSDFSWESKASIPVNHEKTSKTREEAHVVAPSSSRRWRLWPIPFRRAASLQHSNSNSPREELFVDSESAWSPSAEQIPNVNCNQSLRKQLMRIYIPTTEQIASLDLKDGQNIIAFSFSTRVLGPWPVAMGFDEKAAAAAAESGKKTEHDFTNKEDDMINDCPIEQVRLTVPITDDPTLPCLTFRTWVLGLTSCVLLAFVNQFFQYRQNALYVTSVSAQIAALPLGKLMAAWLPSKPIRVPGTRWSFSLNPGPFNLKEHVLVTIFATSGSYGASVAAITSVKAFYRQKLHPLAALLLTLTTQLLGFGWAGLFRRFLVDSPYMWWPSNLVQVSLFRAMHDEEKRPKGGMTRLQFFLTVFISSFAYYIVPNYLFPSISAISFICWIWRDSVKMQQIGSGVYGLGIGSFGLDWSTVAGFLGSPLATPGFAVINILLGFCMVVYVIVPIGYWTNTYNAKRFPIYSSQVFMSNGSRYDVDRVLDPKTFGFSEEGYSEVGQINLSFNFVILYGLMFAAVASSLSHVALFHGRSIWRQMKATFNDQDGDIHTRLMKKNYETVPQWWFYIILVTMLGLGIFTCEGFGKQLQLPYWGVLLAAGLAFSFTLPFGVIAATTNQIPWLSIIADLIIGYIYPGRPLATIVFTTYGFMSKSQAIIFLKDFKLGHYMKIPPKSMFIVQLVGATVAASTTFGTAWWLLETVDGICDRTKLQKGSPWTCPGDEVFYHSSIIWGVVSPVRMFGRLGLYGKMNYFFLLGILAPVPVWALSRIFPEKKWIKLINMPIILGATANMPPARAVNFIMWFAVGIFFNFVVYRRYKGWWARHNYVLSAGLDAGVGFMAILAYLALQSKNIDGIKWWGLQVDDHCPLASCPAAQGIRRENCNLYV